MQRRAIRANFIQAKEGVGRRLTIAPNPTPSFIRVISADGHEVSDEITFSLDAPIGVDVTSETIEVGKSSPIPLPIALALALLIAIGGFFLFERRRSSK